MAGRWISASEAFDNPSAITPPRTDPGSYTPQHSGSYRLVGYRITFPGHVITVPVAPPRRRPVRPGADAQQPTTRPRMARHRAPASGTSTDG
ncbi:hypothetical protein ACIQ9P_03975 [Kitasatospora sp. NPDC094019]|uniref:hypothetical protein n=1 Tax=Kitasatospora sp. NPDC094019 TaxID=3364091 RepID=UPI0038169CF9